MGNPIFLCDVTVSLFSKRGKTVKEEAEYIFRVLLTDTNVESIDRDSYDMHKIARKVIPRVQSHELMDMFDIKFKLKSISVIKQVGETNENKEKKEDEWI